MIDVRCSVFVLQYSKLMLMRVLVTVITEPLLISDPVESVCLEDLKAGSKHAPKSLRPYAADAFLLFQVGVCV